MPNLSPKKIYANFKKAQHIVEIVLIAPFIILIIGIIAEFAIIINTNYKFNSAVYKAINFNALQDKIDIPKEQTLENIKETAKIFLGQSSAPYKNSIQIKIIETDDIDFLIAAYKYTSIFTILNPKGSTYNFSTVIPLNSAILKKNSFNIENDFFETDFEKINLENTDITESESEAEPESSTHSSIIPGAILYE